MSHIECKNSYKILHITSMYLYLLILKRFNINMDNFVQGRVEFDTDEFENSVTPDEKSRK